MLPRQGCSLSPLYLGIYRCKVKDLRRKSEAEGEPCFHAVMLYLCQTCPFPDARSDACLSLGRARMQVLPPAAGLE